MSVQNPETILPERAPVLGVPLRFLLMGVAYLAVLCAVAIWRAPMMVLEYLHNPVTLAVTHLFTLGFAGSVVTGAIYQMIPVILHGRLRSEAAANLHLVLHGAGAACMVLGFLSADTLEVAAGGTLVVLGALLLVVNVLVTVRTSERWNTHGAAIVVALLFYISTLSWGLVMAFNQRYGFLGEVEGAPLATHLTLGLVGWFSLMIVGVGLKLVPMFAPAKPLPARLVQAAVGGVVAGVVITIVGLLTVRPLLWLGVLLMAGALVAYTGAIIYTFLHRRSGPLDHSVRFAVTAGVAGALTALAGLAGLAGLWTGRPWQAALTFFFALAWIGGTIVGMLLRIIPFMVWLHRFRNRTHKLEKIPFLHEMFRHGLGLFTYGAWFAGVVVLTLGFGLQSPETAMAGGAVMLAGVAALAVALGQTLYHVKPGRPALYPGKKS